jgi:hypothetical protein
VFNLISGLAMLVASGFAGWLWDQYGAEATFHAGAIYSLIALSGLAVRWRSLLVLPPER